MTQKLICPHWPHSGCLKPMLNRGGAGLDGKYTVKFLNFQTPENFAVESDL